MGLAAANNHRIVIAQFEIPIVGADGQAEQLTDDQGATWRDKRHAKDQALIDFIDNLIDTYAVVFKRPKRTSVGAPERLNEGRPGGPMIRFLLASLKPILGSETPSEHALRARAREMRKSTTKDF